MGDVPEICSLRGQTGSRITGAERRGEIRAGRQVRESSGSRKVLPKGIETMGKLYICAIQYGSR